MLPPLTVRKKLYQFAAELDGDSDPTWTLTVRIRHGKPKVSLREYFGNVDQEYDNFPEIADVRPRIEKWLGELSESRKAFVHDTNNDEMT